MREETYRLTIQSTETLPAHLIRKGQFLTLDSVLSDDENRYLAKRRTGTVPFYNTDTNLFLFGDEEKDVKNGHKDTWRLYLKLGEDVEDKEKEKRMSTRHRTQLRDQEDNEEEGELVFVSVNGRRMQDTYYIDEPEGPSPINSKSWKECTNSFGLHKTEKTGNDYYFDY